MIQYYINDIRSDQISVLLLTLLGFFFFGSNIQHSPLSYCDTLYFDDMKDVFYLLYNIVIVH